MKISDAKSEFSYQFSQTTTKITGTSGSSATLVENTISESAKQVACTLTENQSIALANDKSRSPGRLLQIQRK
jgi:hypothetical protein